jgi:uncharacterized HhH-GPD family protein
MAEALHFTGNDEADTLLAKEPLALLIGFALDQQVTVPAEADPGRLEEIFREKPAIHRFPGSMAKRVQELAAVVDEEYGGHAERVWTEAVDGADLRKRISSLPGFGEMKIKALGSVLAKRFDVEVAQELVPNHPTLGDVDSPEALEDYQAKKRAHKAEMRAKQSS